MLELWIINGEPHNVIQDGQSAHEDYVREYLIKQFLEDTKHIGILNGIQAILIQHHDDPTMIRTSICDWADMSERSGIITQEDSNDIYGWISRISGFPEVEFQKMCSPSNFDLRHYALTVLKWIRVDVSNIQLDKLTKRTLSEISAGLEKAYGDSVNKKKFMIEEISTRKLFFDVPVPVIQTTKMGAVNQFYAHKTTQPERVLGS